MEDIILNVNNKSYVFKYVQRIKIEEKTRTFTDEELARHWKKGKLVKSLQNIEYNMQKIKELEFCHFRLNKDIKDSGVYMWVINDKIRYIGSAKNLDERFNNGYGIISPRNIFYGGQSTNCKMNRVVVKNQNKKIEIYFYKAKNYIEAKDIEKIMLQSFKNNEQDVLWEELYNIKSL